MAQTVRYDDTGVDQVGAMEDIRPVGTDDRRRYDDFEKRIKPWTPSEIDTIKEAISEEGIGEMPDFPDYPDQQ